MNAVRVRVFIPAFQTPLKIFTLCILHTCKLFCVYATQIFRGISFNLKEKYGIEPTMVVHGVKMLYVPVMPGHSKRLKLT